MTDMTPEEIALEKYPPKYIAETWIRRDSDVNAPLRKAFLEGYNEGLVKGAASQRVKLFEEGLDAVHQDNPSKIEKTIAGVFVKYGMDRMKEQMLKDAIHYVVQDDLDSHGASYNIPLIRIGSIALESKGIGVGDKVRIVILKEEEE